jgi:hypothetical protein
LRLAHCILTCRLVLAPNGTLYISDLGNDGAVVWSNEVQTNRTAATCSPYSLSVLANGVMIERDCLNKTVWVVPQLAGEQRPGILTATRALLCLVVGWLLVLGQYLGLRWQFPATTSIGLAGTKRSSTAAVSLPPLTCAGACRSCEPCERPQYHQQHQQQCLHPHHGASGAASAAAIWRHQRQQCHCTRCGAAAQLQPHDVHHTGQQAGVRHAPGRAYPRGALQVRFCTGCVS